MNVPSPWTAVSALMLDVTKWVGEGAAAPAEEVLFHVIGFSVIRPALEDVEVAVDALIGAGLISATSAELVLTPAGKDLLQRVGRVREESRRLARIQEELATVPPLTASAPWHFGELEWASLLRRHTDEVRGRLSARKDIVDGLIVAVDRLDEINAAVRSAADRPAALALLTRPPFPFSEVQAHHILDMTVSRQTSDARMTLAQESARLGAEIAALRTN